MSLQHPRHDSLYRRNSYTDVVRLHRLPNEVLSNIMRVGLDQSPDEPARAHWLTAVSSTCALWRQIALSTPCLWTRVSLYLEEDGVDVSDPDSEAFLEHRVRSDFDMADTFFQRSGALRLHLTINWSSVDSLPRGLSRFVSLLGAHSHRIGTLVYHGQCSPDRLPGLEASLPSSLPKLTCLEIRTEIVDITADGVPRVFPTSQHLVSEDPNHLGNSRLDYTSPWNLATLHAPKLRTLTYRTYMPTPALAKFVARCERLETLAVSFDALPEGERSRATVLSSSSVRQLMVAGDMWALDAMLGSFPSLEHLKTIPHDVVSLDDLFQTLRNVGNGTRTLLFPSLKTLDLMPHQMYSDEDVDFVLAQPKLQELDLRDAYYPSEILASLVAPDPESLASPRSRRSSCASAVAAPPSPCSSTKSRSSPPVTSHHSPSPTSPLLPSSPSQLPLPPSPVELTPLPSPIPNPALRTLRLHRSRANAATEEEWRQMIVLAQTLLLQRPLLSVHLIGGGVNDFSSSMVDPRTGEPVMVMRCEPELFLMTRLFGERVWITTGAEDEGTCWDGSSLLGAFA